MSAGVSYSEEIWMEINLAHKKRILDIVTRTLFNHQMSDWPLYGGPCSVDPGAEVVSSVLEAGAPDDQAVVPHHGDGSVLHSSKPAESRELLGEQISQNKRWEHSATPLGDNNHLSVSSKRGKKRKCFYYVQYLKPRSSNSFGF